MRRWLASLAAALAAGCASAPPAPDPALERAVGHLLQADAVAALADLDHVDPANLTPRRKEIIDCIRGRFAGGDEANGLPPVSSAALVAYQRYWRGAMLRQDPPAKAGEKLLASLHAIPALAAAKDPSSLDSVSDYLVTAIEAEGLHALTGKTEPLYELMIWKREEPHVYDVALPEGRVNVKVVFLDDFVSTGWSGYATCGIASTGGWAKPDALYAVKSSYDLDSENFRVSYLAHEGQHFSDYQRFPMLEQPELEYRAKLTEIALSTTTTATLLAQFEAQAGPSRDSPHAFADGHVVRALKGVPADRIHEAAAAKLRESTATLERMGAGTARRFLPD